MDKKIKAKYFFIAALLFFFILVPVLTVFSEALMPEGRFAPAHAIHVVLQAENLKTVFNSLLLGFLVVVTSSLLAVPLAFLLAKSRFARYRWLDILFLVPFMTPPYIASMGWILFVQRRGLFQQLFPFTGHLSEVFLSLAGLTLVMSFHSFPFMTTILKNAILNLGDNLDESARICGAGFRYRLRKITLPLLKGNFAIAMLLVFVKTLSEYGTPATLGRRIGFAVFTTDIHRFASTAPIDFGTAASLSSVLVVICMVMWLLQTYVTDKNTYAVVGGKGNRSGSTSSRFVTLAGGAYIALLMLVTIGIPYFSVLSTSLIKLRGFGLAPGNFTLEHYATLLTESDGGLDALLTSTALAVASAILVSIAGTLIVVAIRKAGRWKKVISGFALFPQMIPNIVLVIGLMLFWNKIYAFVPLYNTLGFMVLVYSVMFLPYSIQYVSSSLMQISGSLLMAGRVCGGSRGYVFRRITLPLVMKGILAGWMMTFIIVFRELVASSLIAPPNTLTVSTFILSEFEQGSVSVGMAMAVLCVLFTTAVLIGMNHLTGKR